MMRGYRWTAGLMLVALTTAAVATPAGAAFADAHGGTAFAEAAAGVASAGATHVALASAAGAASSRVGESSTVWAQPGFDPGQTYYNPGETKLNAATVGKLKRRWSVTVKATPDLCTLNTPPLAAAGRLFTTDPSGVAAYGATTGKALWHWTFPAISPDRSHRESFGDLSLAGGLLIALTHPCEDGPGQFAYLTALDPATGAQKWRVPMDRNTNALAVDRGVAAVGNWGGVNDGPQSTTGFRVTDGAQLWKVPGYKLTNSVSAGGRLLLPRADYKSARAISIVTGKTLWSTDRPWAPRAAAPAGDRFLISTDFQGMASVNAATGALQWSTKHGAAVADDGRRIYLAYNSIVETYDARTGHKLHVSQLADHGGQPVRAGGLLYLTVGSKNPIAILDPATGKTLATYPEMKLLAQPPVIVNGWLYTTDGETMRGYAP